MKYTELFYIAASVALTSCSNNQAIGTNVATCYKDQSKAEVIDSQTGNTVWSSIGHILPGKSVNRVDAMKSDGHSDKMTIDDKNRVCIIGNPDSDGKLVFKLETGFPRPSI